MGIEHLTVTVRERRQIAQDVIRIECVARDGALPQWTPGAHVDVMLPNGDARQYSLAGSPADPRNWAIGVLVEASGRGGSLWISEHAQPGAELILSVPRNHFEYSSGGARRKVFIAGGIGVTPLLPMIEQADSDGLDWHLHYVGRALEHMGFLDHLAQYGARVTLYPRDRGERPDIEALVVTGAPVDVYCCGPEALMDAVENLGRAHDDVAAHVERFTPKPMGEERGFDEFDVVFDYSGREGRVTADKTILQVAEECGIEVPTSCREGTCGTCETPVMEGAVVHHDSILTDAEREASATMMICISRANCPRLVIDL